MKQDCSCSSSLIDANEKCVYKKGINEQKANFKIEQYETLKVGCSFFL
jgi:hypothetical protein